MAHIRRRKNGNWQVIIRKKNYPDIVRTFLEKGTASKWSKQIETQMDKKIFEDMSGAESTTLSQLVKKYRDEVVPELKSTKHYTYKLNKLLKHKICYYNLLQLNSSNVYQYKKELQKEGLAPKTININLQMLRRIWYIAKVRWNITLPAQSPFALVPMEKVNNERDIQLTDAEFTKLLDVASNSKLHCLADMIRFASRSLARYSEIVGLRRENVDFNKKTATFMETKTTPSHTIPLHDDAIAILKKYPFGDTFFHVKSRESFRHYWEKVRKEAGLPDFRFHDLRSFGANRYLLSGMSEIEVAAIGNWKTLAVLHRRYSRIKPVQLLQKINNVVNLER
ncbi:MAG: site-specific integrase [Alphaproteobacteria bacterium]|jgi:integrase|nr:site-specific integrase [Alphaproteobacteria bacterium]|tara:strand:+ start:143 stop:1153 length:1011 start_codon:yes stop_codon:yes gene_type:complete